MQTWNCVAKIPLLCTLPLRSTTVSILKKNISFGGLPPGPCEVTSFTHRLEKNIKYQWTNCNNFATFSGGSLWPFCDGENVSRTQRLSDLWLGVRKVTLNHLGCFFLFLCISVVQSGENQQQHGGHVEKRLDANSWLYHSYALRTQLGVMNARFIGVKTVIYN